MRTETRRTLEAVGNGLVVVVVAAAAIGAVLYGLVIVAWFVLLNFFGGVQFG